MALTLMYITNNPITAQIAQEAGVDRIWIDMEYIGKDERQGGMDTVKNHHTIDDIKKMRPIVTNAELMVRVNPLHTATDDYYGSEDEINQSIEAGADVIMLPMFKTADDVKRFVIHIGLNDLHLAMHKVFMFELICDDTVASLCKKMKAKGIKYGFGGIARVGYGMLPAEYIIAEHYHLGSTAAILSRGFCDANIVKDPMEIEAIFVKGVRNIRLKEHEVVQYSEEQYLKNLDIIREKVSVIAANKKGKG